jgi:hypothetical protein
MIRWLEDLIAVPRPDPSDFMASVSFLLHLKPGDAAAKLEQRAGRLEAQIAAMAKAELQWVRDLIGDIRSGRLTWNIQNILEILRALAAQQATAKEHTK